MAASDKKLVRSKSGLKIVALSDEGTSPFAIKEPHWVPDNECRACMKCQKTFDFFCRRHHCRRCGECFCGSCCEKMVALPRMCFVDPVRQCEECANTTKKENDFFDKHLKTLTTGGHFYVHGTDYDVDEAPVYLCKLSTDHRFVRFEGGENQADLDPVELALVESLQILASGTDPQGNAVATGMCLRYIDTTAEHQDLRLVATETSLKRQAMCWVAAMQKGMKLIYENRNEANTK